MLPIIGHGFGPGGSGSEEEDFVANFRKRYIKIDNMKVENAMSHRDMIFFFCFCDDDDDDKGQGCKVVCKNKSVFGKESS